MLMIHYRVTTFIYNRMSRDEHKARRQLKLAGYVMFHMNIQRWHKPGLVVEVHESDNRKIVDSF